MRPRNCSDLSRSNRGILYPLQLLLNQTAGRFGCGTNKQIGRLQHMMKAVGDEIHASASRAVIAHVGCKKTRISQLADGSRERRVCGEVSVLTQRQMSRANSRDQGTCLGGQRSESICEGLH